MNHFFQRPGFASPNTLCSLSRGEFKSAIYVCANFNKVLTFPSKCRVEFAFTRIQAIFLELRLTFHAEFTHLSKIFPKWTPWNLIGNVMKDGCVVKVTRQSSCDHKSVYIFWCKLHTYCIPWAKRAGAAALHFDRLYSLGLHSNLP
jgi:hypothetical protein